MTQPNGNQNPHRAQVFLWWVSGIGIICAGLWTVFTFFLPSIEELYIEADTLVVQTNDFGEEAAQSLYKGLELEQLRREGGIPDVQEEDYKAIIKYLGQQKKSLYVEYAILQEKFSKASLTESEQGVAEEKLQVVKFSLDNSWLEPFSIWNNDDPIRILKEFGWRVQSNDKFYGYLGYYVEISHDKVLDETNIIVSRIFDLDRLKDSQDDWQNQIQLISERCGCPLIFLDESYYNLYADTSSSVGGLIYLADKTHTVREPLSMHEPLSEWRKQLPRLLGFERGDG